MRTNYKKCGECLITKPTSEFYKDKQTTDGYRWKCKDCKKKEVAKYMKDNPTRINWAKGYYHKNTRTHKNSTLLRNFGITLEQYEEMKLKQNNVCAICKQPETTLSTVGQPRELCVDHNHKTKKNRKLLCQKCNTGIGSFKEDIRLLENAILYIKEHNEEI